MAVWLVGCQAECPFVCMSVCLSFRLSVCPSDWLFGYAPLGAEARRYCRHIGREIARKHMRMWYVVCCMWLSTR
jgi:hypothetical protein